MMVALLNFIFFSFYTLWQGNTFLNYRISCTQQEMLSFLLQSKYIFQLQKLFLDLEVIALCTPYTYLSSQMKYIPHQSSLVLGSSFADTFFFNLNIAVKIGGYKIYICPLLWVQGVNRYSFYFCCFAPRDILCILKMDECLCIFHGLVILVSLVELLDAFFKYPSRKLKFAFIIIIFKTRRFPV